LLDHLQRVIMTKCPIIDKVPHFDVIDNQLQETVDGLLDEPQIRGQHDVAAIPIFPAWRASSFARGLFLRRFRRLIPPHSLYQLSIF
jgi:hypothetical protein